MKNNRWGCFAPLILIVLLVAAAVWLRIPASLRAWSLLNRTMEQRNLGGTVTVRSEEFAISGDVYWCEVSDDRYVCLNAGGENLYFHDEEIWFANGRGYDLEPLLDGLGDFDEKLFLLAGFRTEKQDGKILYTLQMDESRLALLERFAPNAHYLADSTLTMVEENGELMELNVTAQGISVQASLDHTIQKTIPTEVLMQMTDANLRDVRTLAPLFNACSELVGQSVFGADVKLDVDCGPLPISDTAQVYGTKEALYFSRSGQISELSLSGMEDTSSMFWALGFSLIRDGELASNTDGTQSYTLTVEAETLSGLLATVLPELEGLNISLSDGTLTVMLENERLTGMALACSGEMPFLIATIPIELSVELARMDGAVTLPDGIE